MVKILIFNGLIMQNCIREDCSGFPAVLGGLSRQNNCSIGLFLPSIDL